MAKIHQFTVCKGGKGGLGNVHFKSATHQAPKEFTKGDKFIYIVSYAWIVLWTLIFIVGTIYSLTHDVQDSTWLIYWKYNVIIYALVSAVVLIWFTIGGIIDMKAMFKQLSVMKRDETDDGYVSK